MKELIVRRARELGFDACRITTADPPRTAQAFQAWLDASFHGEMHYLQRNGHKRVNPDAVLAGARSIIVLAASYHLNDAQRNAPVPGRNHGGQRTEIEAAASGMNSDRRPTNSNSGVIARYARFADYHSVLGERLRILTEYLNRLGGPEARSLWYVDTGPFLERDLAQRAGIGFAGKHTGVISRELGNWFFLAEIITSVALPADPAETNRCGSCTRCLQACPTGAIVAPFQLDARRCISYLTIELKGAIPEPLRPAIGNRIYGCDDCLDVCPWNRFAKESSLMAEHADPGLQSPDLVDLLGMDDVTFRERFRNTPILRAKRRGFLRNVCVALGNIGTPEALPALERAARDPEPLIAEHARWAIEQIENRRTKAAGCQTAEKE